MSLRRITMGLRSLFKRADLDRELEDELRHYVELSAAAKVRDGMSPEHAERAARLELGGAEVVKENVRTAGWEAIVDSVVRDIRHSLRSLARSPAYTVVAVATLGIGIAATTTELTVANTVLRQHWPVRDPSRVFTMIGRRGGPGFSPATARYLDTRAKSFNGIIAVRCLGGVHTECLLRVNESSANVDFVSGNYFTVLGSGVSAGRGFVADEDRLDAPRAVAVISDAMWRVRLGSDPAVVGKTIHIDDVPFTIVGVASREFTGTRTERKDVWLPLSSMVLLRPNRSEIVDQLETASADRSEAAVAGRLADGATIGQAQAELAALNRSYLQEHQLEDLGVRLIPTTFFPNPAKLRTAGLIFALMFAAVTLVLLLACANVGNLLLARATTRGREIAIRLALGASRRRIVRQLLIESLLLAVAAGSIGIGASFIVPGAIMTRVFGGVSWHFAPDVVVLGATTFLTALTCVAFGLAPALHVTRTDASAVLKSGDIRGGGSTARTRLRGALLAVQIAISLLLLVNAGLLVRGIARGRDAGAGFKTAAVATVAFELPASYAPARIAAFNRQIMNETRTFPGARFGFANDIPLGAGRAMELRLPGDPAAKTRGAAVFSMSPAVFDILELPIVAGRNFSSAGDEDALLVNESLARDLWPGESPLGKVVLESTGERHVIGVVKDASVIHIGRIDPAAFRPIAVDRAASMLMITPAPATIAALTQIATRIDARARVRIDSIAGNVERQLGGLAAMATLAGVLGVIALVIAALGVFGVFAYTVQARTREIGIRTALGASPHQVAAVILRESTRAIVSGLAAGAFASLVTGRAIASELYGASIFDPAVLGATGLVLTIAGLLASWIPARRAADIDPVIALRDD